MKRKFLISAVLVLLFFSNQFIYNAVCTIWEVKTQTVSEIKEHYKYGVVLGGMATADKATGQLQFSASVDRLIEAIILYKNGKVDKLVLSGGSGAVIYNEVKEAPILKNLCITLGIPVSDIIEEPLSRNTHENAEFTKDLIGTDSSVILITSAFHMRRSIGCFKKEGFKFDVLSTDPLRKFNLGPDDYFIPKAEVLVGWTVIIKEWIGCIAYWIAGYI